MDRRKYLDSAEVQQLRRNTENWAIADLAKGRRQGPLAWMLVDLALLTGLRVSEIAAITLPNVDFKRACITVTRVKKKKPVQESLMIDSGLIKHLREFIDHQRPQTDSDHLWIGKRGPLTSQGLEVLWKRAVVLAGFTEKNKNGKTCARYSIHCARHTCATHLLKKTGNLRQVQKQLGHCNPTVTANLYADIAPEDMQAGVEGLYA